MQAPGIEAISRQSAAAAGVEAGATLEVSLGRIGTALEAQHRHRMQIAAGITYIPGISFPGFAGSALPLTPGSSFGPRNGYTWAVMAIRAAGLGTADFLNLYRGNSPTAAQPNTALATLTVTVAGAIASQLFGGSGLLLSGNEQASLVFGGTVASALVTVNLDVIQIADAQLPFYLL